MSMDHDTLMYSLACTFQNTFNVTLGENATTFVETYGKKFHKLTTVEKVYYTKYTLKLAESFAEQMGMIREFEINTDPEAEIVHDFSITPKKGSVRYIVMSHKHINVKDIIPEKLPKLCKYSKNTTVAKEFGAGYQHINTTAMKKIQSKSLYNEVTDKLKRKSIYEPICNLVIDSFSMKRKCATSFYHALFDESDRIILKLYKNKFVMYDFGKAMEEASSYKMKLTDHDEVTVTFNNKAEFAMKLKINNAEIKEKLSLKFHVDFKNMDELFASTSVTV